MPTVNQIELHPLLQQAELRAWHAEHGIATEAWSPLAQGEVLERRHPGHDRRPPPAHRRPGRPPLAPAARQRRDPQVGDPGAGARELRPLRLRADRGRHGGDRPTRCRPPHRARPGHLRRSVGRTGSPRGPSSSAARSSRSAPLLAQADVGGPRLAAVVYMVGGVFFSTGGYASVLLAINAPHRRRDGSWARGPLALVGARTGQLRLPRRRRPLRRHPRLRRQPRRLAARRT